MGMETNHACTQSRWSICVGVPGFYVPYPVCFAAILNMYMAAFTVSATAYESGSSGTRK